MKYLVFILAIAFGFYVITHSYGTARLFGRMDWAERYLGVGGTYTAWKLIGILSIFGGFAVLRWPGFFGL